MGRIFIPILCLMLILALLFISAPVFAGSTTQGGTDIAITGVAEPPVITPQNSVDRFNYFYIFAGIVALLAGSTVLVWKQLHVLLCAILGKLNTLYGLRLLVAERVWFPRKTLIIGG